MSAEDLSLAKPEVTTHDGLVSVLVSVSIGECIFLCRLTECRYRAIGLFPLDKHSGMMRQVGPGLPG